MARGRRLCLLISPRFALCMVCLLRITLWKWIASISCLASSPRHYLIISLISPLSVWALAALGRTLFSGVGPGSNAAYLFSPALYATSAKPEHLRLR